MSTGRRQRATFNRARGIGAGAWQRRRRRSSGAPLPDLGAVASVDPTWMSLSLDPSSDGNAAALSFASVSLEEISSAPELQDEALVARTERPEAPTMEEPTEPDAPSSVSSSSVSVSSSSVSVSSSSVSISDEVEVAPASISVASPGMFAEEATEAIEVPLPPPVPVRLAEEPLPWPVILVPPTVVLPGSWPPPPGSLLESEPSGVVDMNSGVEELAIEPMDTGDDLLELELDAPSEDQLQAVVPRAQIDFEDSAIDLVIEDPSVIESMAGPPAWVDSVEEPPIRGTLDDMPVVAKARVTPVKEAEPPSESAELDLDEDDEPPTEVSQRDALEAALDALRSTRDSSELVLETDDVLLDEDPEPITATADDLLSLEFDDGEDSVDPDVLADLGAIGLPSADTSEQPPVQVAPRLGVFLELGAPSPAVVFSPQPAVWLETVDPAGGESAIPSLAEPAPDDTPTAPPQLPLERAPGRSPEPASLDLDPATTSIELDPGTASLELDPGTDSLELESTSITLDPATASVSLEADSITFDPTRTEDPTEEEFSVDESIDFVLQEDTGPESLTLEADSVSELGPVAVDLALGAPAPDRGAATAGVAVPPPEPVRSWEGRTGAEQEERTTDLVALARLTREDGAPPPAADVAQDLTAADLSSPVADATGDDWLAELPEAPPPGSMSPHYQDTVPGWMAGGEGRGAPKTGRPEPLAPLVPEADTDLGGSHDGD